MSSNKRINSLSKNNYNNNDNRNIEVNELFNRFKKENSKYTTIQNTEEVSNSTIKYNDKKYFYQTQDKDKNNYKDNNSEFTNYFNKSNIPKHFNKTYQIKKQNQKNKLIYNNHFNSFDKNNDNKESNNECDEEIKEKISSYYNRKKQYDLDNKNKNDNNSKTNDDGDNCLKLDSCSDYINFDRPRVSNNKISSYNNNSKIITKTIRPKKIITDSLKRKKYSNSFNNEIIDSECDNYIKNDSKIQKKSQRIILDRSLTNFNNQCFYRKSSIGLNHYTNNNNSNNNNNNNDINSSLFFKKLINQTVKTSPKIIDDNTSKNSNYQTKLEKEDPNSNNYFYSNCKTKEHFYRDSNNIYRKTNNIDNSNESSQNGNKRFLNRKKNSQNHYGFNHFRIPFDNSKNVEFNRTCYLKKPIDKNPNI